MVSDQSRGLDGVFHALAHPARRAMLWRLSEGECNLTELSAPLKMSFAGASKHVRVLERARLVKRRVDGRSHVCRLDPGPLQDIALWTERFRAHWESNFKALDGLLEQMQKDKRTRRERR